MKVSRSISLSSQTAWQADKIIEEKNISFSHFVEQAIKEKIESENKEAKI